MIRHGQIKMFLSNLLLGLFLMYGPNANAELNCLADNIYHEARGESIEGQIAVTHVVFNRTHSQNFPNGYCDVIKQAKLNPINGEPLRNRCQFSWYCDGKSDVPRDVDAWMEAVETARIAWNQYYLQNRDFSYGADHYHATHVDPYWNDSMHMTINIENHLFYKSN